MDDLIVSLRREPSDEERALAEGVGLHDGACIPFHMFAKVAVRQHKDAGTIDEMAAMRQWFRRRAWALLLALAANVLGVGGFIVHRIRTSGADEERELRQAKDIETMQKEIWDLRKICGLDPQGMGIVQLGR